MRAVVCFLALLVAGCASTPAGEPQETDAARPVAAEPLVKAYMGEHELLVNPDLELIGIGGASRNCVFFWDTDGASYKIVNGTATLSWDALPTTMAMRLRTTGADPEPEATGGSPLVMALEGIELAHDWGLGFWADYSLTDATLPVAQQATLALEFTYEGELPEPRAGTCAGGGF